MSVSSAVTPARSETDRVPATHDIAGPRLGPGELDRFRRNGFLPVRGLFTDAAIEGLRALAERRIEEQHGGYAGSLSRVAYRLHEEPHVEQLLRDPSFREVLTGLAASSLVPTESQAFELSTGNAGIPWHYGYISFGYVRARDMGYTLWIPLSPIDAAAGGGMAYVPEHLISARHAFDMGTLLAEELNDGDEPEALLAAFERVQEQMEPVFEQHRIEDSFAVGDAFFFNKYVWHRSAPYRGGGEQRRLGIAMRFVEDTARIDRVRWRAEFAFGGGVGTGQRRPVVSGVEDRYTRFPDVMHGDLVRSSAECRLVI